MRERREAALQHRHQQRLAGEFLWGDSCGVYFLWCDGYVKIGHSTDAYRRVRSIKNANPHTVVPLGFTVTRTADAAEKLEAEMHQRFRHLRRRGEWFAFDKQLLDVIAATTVFWPFDLMWQCMVSTWNATNANSVTSAATT